MPGVRTRFLPLLAALSLALAGAIAVVGMAPVASAAPNDVIADYFVDGILDGGYSVDDLRAALAFAQKRVGSGAQYTAFADIVSEAITRDLAGTDDPGAAAERQLQAQTKQPKQKASPPPAPTDTVPDDGLPTPPPSDPNDQLPMAVPIMGFVAIGLVAIGSFSAFWRRRRRR